MTDSGFAEFPDSWQNQLLASLSSTDRSLARMALGAIGSTRNGQFDDALQRFSRDEAQPVSLRIRAISVLSRNDSELVGPTFDFLCQQLGPDGAFETRLDAARSLGNSKLTPAQLDALIPLTVEAGPLELPLLLRSLADVWKHDSMASGQRLITALESSPGFARLTGDQLKRLFEAAPAELQPKAESLHHRRREESATSIQTHLRTSFILAGGDSARGKEIFYGKRALCSACHRAGPGEQSRSART